MGAVQHSVTPKQRDAVPLDRRHKLAGPILTVQANNDLVAVLGAVHAAQPGEVVVIANETAEVGLIGDLIVADAQRKGLAGFVIDGQVRDASALVECGVPVVCRGVIPIGPLKLPAHLKGIGRSGVEIRLGDVAIKPGDWVFGDTDGVIVLAARHLAGTFEWAEKSWQREEALLAQIRAGAALGDLLGVDAFLRKRARDGAADFNAHLAELGHAI